MHECNRNDINALPFFATPTYQGCCVPVSIRNVVSMPENVEQENRILFGSAKYSNDISRPPETYLLAEKKNKWKTKLHLFTFP